MKKTSILGSCQVRFAAEKARNSLPLTKRGALKPLNGKQILYTKELATIKVMLDSCARRTA